MAVIHMKDAANKIVAREQRFPIHAIVRYRVRGGKIWHEGNVENVSNSGILFQGTQLMNINTPIEVCFALPGRATGEEGAKVMGRGSVIRVQKLQEDSSSVLIAASITHFRFVRR